MGFNGMFGNLGLAVAPLMTGLVTWIWGPKAAYLVLGGMNLFGVILLSRTPLISGSRQTKKKEENGGNLKGFGILLIAMMLGGIVYRGATVITPAYFELKNQAIFQGISSLVSGNLSENFVATTITSGIFLVGMLGQYTGGKLAERFDPRFCYLAFHAVTIPVAVLMSMAANIPLVVLAMIYFFFLLGMQPSENTLVAKYTPRRLHHSAFGAKFVLTFGVGALAVKMVKAIQVHSGIEQVFMALGGISLVLVAVILVLIAGTRRGRDF